MSFKPSSESVSKSPMKPEKFYKALIKKAEVEVLGFRPVSMSDLRIAHTGAYIDGMLNGVRPYCNTSDIPWEKKYPLSARYCVGALMKAVEKAVDGERFSVCPVSGFHHAKPTRGLSFCAFSGQVIASVKEFRKSGSVGCYIDLDSHFGNSIEDSRKFVPDLNQAVPEGYNVNPTGYGRSYIRSLKRSLSKVEKRLPDYVVYCHGADSCKGDDLGFGQCTQDEWFECTTIVCEWAKRHNLPLVLTLFGGYSSKYNSVIDLHVKDALLCESIIDRDRHIASKNTYQP